MDGGGDHKRSRGAEVVWYEESIKYRRLRAAGVKSDYADDCRSLTDSDHELESIANSHQHLQPSLFV